MKSPVKYEVYLEKFNRGKWEVAILNRKGDDFCALIQNPMEPWYDFFSKFKHKYCPFPPGHVETFKNQKMAAAPEFIPRNFIGKYRCTVKYIFPEDNGEQTDCCSLIMEVVEV